MIDAHDPLGEVLARFRADGQIFAVVDAAHFDYLQDTLTLQRFRFDVLYLDEVDNPSIASGPHLVHVTGPSQIAALREIVGDAPACVWWVWPDTRDAAEAIRQHLRKLSMVEIPEDRPDAPVGRVHDGLAMPRRHGYEPFLLRHGDANVMAMLLPILEAPQISRVFSAAKAITFDAPDVCGVRAFEGAADLPKPRSGMLRIERGAQYQALTDGYNDALRNRAIREFSSFPEANPSRIDSAFDRAEGYGFATKDLIWEFIDLDMKHGARFEKRAGRDALRQTLSSVSLNSYKKIHTVKTVLAAEKDCSSLL